MNLVELIILKYGPIDTLKDVIFQDDGKGPYIRVWNLEQPEPTKAQLTAWLADESIIVEKGINDAIAVLDDLINKKAKEKGYDSTLSICTYLTSTNEQWAAEAKAFVAWRDDIWTTAIKIKDDILAKSRAVPTQEEFLQELPTLVWP